MMIFHSTASRIHMRLIAICLLAVSTLAFGQSPQESDTPKVDAPSEPGIFQRQQKVTDSYKRLEELLIRLADVEASTNPERAALLRRAARQSSETFVLKQLESATEAIKDKQYQLAIDNQSAAKKNLGSLLKLLLTEDRQERIRDEKDRIKRIKKDMERQLRRQIATRNRTENNGDAGRLKEEQGDIADKTGEIGKELDGSDAEDSDSEGKQSEGKQSEGEQSEGEQSEGEQSEGEQSEGEQSEGKQSEGKQSEGKQSEGKQSEGKQSEGKQSEGKQSEGQQSEGQQSEGQQSEGQQSEGQQSEGQQSEGQQSEGQQSEQESQPSSPQQSAAQRLKKAQERMREAQEQLDKAKRDKAVEKQREAEQLVRQAIDDLDRILRQLREEERERELARLEARFRKMAEMQAEIYDSTRELSEIPMEARDRSVDIRAGNLAFEEKKIVLEADRAMLVLKEEGSSVAFPEVVQQMRTDMQSIATRLAKSKIDIVTQGLEEDVLAALEEMIAALQQAQRELEEQKAQQQQQQQQQQGAPGEKPLVEPIAELKLIRTLEKRIKKTTERYAKIIPENTEAVPTDILELVEELSDRQLRLYRVTRDIVLKKNR